MKSIVLQWPSFGPYHTARLEACAAAAPEGVEVVGLAVAGQVQGRPWVADRAMERVRVTTLFPDAMYHELPRRAVAAAMTRALDDLRPTAVGVSGYGMADSRAALRWCVKHNARRVLMTESKVDDAPRVWWKEWIKRRLVAKFDSGLCGGSPHRGYLEELGMPPEKIFDRYDVVDNARFATAAEAVRRDPDAWNHLPGLSGGTPFFLVSSRFIDRKNLLRLIEAYAAYVERFQGSVFRVQDGETRPAVPWGLCILGDGEQKPALLAKCRDLGLEVVDSASSDASSLKTENLNLKTHPHGVVWMPGFRQFDEISAYYALSGAFIHPALQEQWGLVVNEAMACGLPVLCSKTVGAAHDLVIDGRNGRKFDPTSAEAMCEAMCEVSTNADRRDEMGRESRKIIAEWTPEDFARNFWRAVGDCNGEW